MKASGRHLDDLCSARASLLCSPPSNESLRSNRESMLMAGRFKLLSRKVQRHTQPGGGASTRRRTRLRLLSFRKDSSMI